MAVALLPVSAEAATGAWVRFSASDEASSREVSHVAWDALLERYVVAGDAGIHLFRYGEVSREDRRALEKYLDELSAVAPSKLTRARQLPFWINLYNALTIRVVLDHYPVDSIRDIRPTWLQRGPWKKAWLSVDGEPITLDDIEHRILRPIWRDPRIHYAVNCASLGCPNLQRVAFTEANAEELLESAARAFVNHPRAASIEDGDLIVSSIYHWFREDFGDSERGVLDHLRRYAEPRLAGRLRGIQEIHDHRYDWSLNDAGR
ncbi:MAG: DUF547 domain-containing protein [Myxococcales bacterium]|nr:DUF547 domain-containing protein [Myxococcales bacterium]